MAGGSEEFSIPDSQFSSRKRCEATAAAQTGAKREPDRAKHYSTTAPTTALQAANQYFGIAVDELVEFVIWFWRCLSPAFSRGAGSLPNRRGARKHESGERLFPAFLSQTVFQYPIGVWRLSVFPSQTQSQAQETRA